MRKIKIVADSSSDVLEFSGVDFASVPLKIISSEREFVDDESLSTEEMVHYFDNYKGRSKTSCPNTAEWIEAFGDADEVFCVTITSGLSGSYNAAMAAKKIYESENEGKQVFVLDSLSTGPEMRLAIEKMAEYIKMGLPFDIICDSIKKYTKKTGLIFMLKSMKNLANNGRVSPVAAKVAGIFGIHVVGKASDEGTLEQMHKCVGEKRALATIVSDLASLGLRTGKVRIAHCLNEAAALHLTELIKQKFEKVQIEIHKCRGLCSFYAEMGGILIGFEKA